MVLARQPLLVLWLVRRTRGRHLALLAVSANAVIADAPSRCAPKNSQLQPALSTRLVPSAAMYFFASAASCSFSSSMLIADVTAMNYMSPIYVTIGAALFHRDGTRLVRYPEPNAELAPNFADSPNVQRFLRETSGSFVGVTPSDGIERLYTFTQVGDLPLYINVALSTREIEAEWRDKALVIGLLVLALSAILTVQVLGGTLPARAASLRRTTHQLGRAVLADLDADYATLLDRRRS